MPQSHCKVLVHLVFSTKNRKPLLQDAWRENLHAYLSGIVEQHGCVLIIANSVNDHIHMLLGLGRNIAISDLVKEIKTGSSKWVHRYQPGNDAFAWQRGYGIFSISPADKPKVVNYIRNQAEHHKTMTFQDEFRRLLGIYVVEYDEAYVWD